MSVYFTASFRAIGHIPQGGRAEDFKFHTEADSADVGALFHGIKLSVEAVAQHLAQLRANLAALFRNHVGSQGFHVLYKLEKEIYGSVLLPWSLSLALTQSF